MSFAATLAAGLSPALFAAPCESPRTFPADNPTLSVRDGYLDFIPPEQLRPFKAALPAVDKAQLTEILASADTVWYDEESMIFLYQDSVESVVGGRANCVGRKVGERNRGNVIGKLLNYFGPDYRFKFPFRTVAGTDDVKNIKSLNFWSPPRQDGRVLPVKWWKSSARGRWNWVFPVGTLFGEVLYQKGPDGRWYVFEIRTRTRYLDGWATDVLRPFAVATALASAIERARPGWEESASLAAAVRHLRSPDSLTPSSLVSPAYGKIFPAIHGSLDLIPAFEASLVAELLTTTTFRSVEGRIWKEDGRGLETYAPGSQADFSIVPKGYTMGLIPVNEVSCDRCHRETGRGLKDLDFDVILYGEVWGEDRIFTWHLFEPNKRIFDTFDDTDVSRVINGRMVRAGLLRNEKPGVNDPLYRKLPVPYKP